MKRNQLAGIIVAFGLGLMLCAQFLLGCNEPDPIAADGIQGPERDPVGNIPPDTYISLGLPPGQLPDTSVSKKLVHWWGEDSDGWIEAYRYRWGQLLPDSTDTTAAPDTAWINDGWVETQLDSGQFILPIRTAAAAFTFQVYAIDNQGAADSTVAQVTYPVVNSRPSIEYRIMSNPMSVADTFYTFTTRTFVWDVFDPDGVETIDRIQYALNPQPGDTQWVDIEGAPASLTLRDLEAGDYVFWARVIDVAGFTSPTIHFPDTSIVTDPNVWHVREPQGRYLIVDDAPDQENNAYLSIYQSIFDSLYGRENYSVWEIGEELPYSIVDVIESMMFFDRILWYSSLGSPRIKNAYNSVYSYVESQDKRLFLTVTRMDSGMVGLGTGDAGGEFEPLVEEMAPFVNRIEPETVNLIPSQPEVLDTLAISDWILFPVTGFVPKQNVEPIYHMSDHASFEGNPIVGLRKRFSASNSEYTVLALPLTSLNGRNNIHQVIQVLFDE